MHRLADAFLCLFYALTLTFSTFTSYFFPLNFCSLLLLPMLQEVTELGLLLRSYFPLDG